MATEKNVDKLEKIKKKKVCALLGYKASFTDSRRAFLNFLENHANVKFLNAETFEIFASDCDRNRFISLFG